MSQNLDINMIALIGFDVTEGPVLKWKKCYKDGNNIEIDQFYTNFYIMFKGGGKFKPKMIMFEDFQIIAFQNQMDLLCVFMENKVNKEYLEKINKFAEKECSSFRNNPSKVESESDKIKEQLIKILKEQKELTIRQLKKHFPLSYWTIRRYLTDLEEDGLVKRNKKQKEHLWSAT
ncbi:MAG: DeoR family transcriptional regulator [Candidatus Helarchaeota archaeon]